jgi:predicted RNase H-like nuclease (RuvC/YqgF family)
MFETAGVARTERSITNWCQPNKSGIARLDAYFDPNERRYFITPQSIELAIQEEKAKATKVNQPSEPGGIIPNASEEAEDRTEPESEVDAGRVKDLEREVMDLKITNRGKDYFIEQLQKERDGFDREREGYVEKLMTFNRKVGELETKLLQLASPREENKDASTSTDLRGREPHSS